MLGIPLVPFFLATKKPEKVLPIPPPPLLPSAPAPSFCYFRPKNTDQCVVCGVPGIQQQDSFSISSLSLPFPARPCPAPAFPSARQFSRVCGKTKNSNQKTVPISGSLSLCLCAVVRLRYGCVLMLYISACSQLVPSTPVPFPSPSRTHCGTVVAFVRRFFFSIISSSLTAHTHTVRCCRPIFCGAVRSSHLNLRPPLSPTLGVFERGVCFPGCHPITQVALQRVAFSNFNRYTSLSNVLMPRVSPTLFPVHSGPDGRLWGAGGSKERWRTGQTRTSYAPYIFCFFLGVLCFFFSFLLLALSSCLSPHGLFLGC